MNIANKRFLLILFFCTGILFSRDDDPRYWWQVEIRAAVTGQYAHQTNDGGFAGNYSFTAVILGSMDDDDNDDFIFLHAHREISGIKWEETIYTQNEKKQLNRQQIELETNLNYVFARQGKLAFDIEIMPVSVPGETSPGIGPGKNLHLPESAGDETVTDKNHYNKGITRGSNRVVLPVKEMYTQKEVHRIFKWQWQEKNPDSSWSHGHNVEVSLKIIPKLRDE